MTALALDFATHVNITGDATSHSQHSAVNHVHDKSLRHTFHGELKVPPLNITLHTFSAEGEWRLLDLSQACVAAGASNATSTTPPPMHLCRSGGLAVLPAMKIPLSVQASEQKPGLNAVRLTLFLAGCSSKDSVKGFARGKMDDFACVDMSFHQLLGIQQHASQHESSVIRYITWTNDASPKPLLWTITMPFDKEAQHLAQQVPPSVTNTLEATTQSAASLQATIRKFSAVRSEKIAAAATELAGNQPHTLTLLQSGNQLMLQEAPSTADYFKQLQFRVPLDVTGGPIGQTHVNSQQDATQIVKAMSEQMRRAQMAEQMGQPASKAVESMNVTWGWEAATEAMRNFVELRPAAHCSAFVESLTLATAMRMHELGRNVHDDAQVRQYLTGLGTKTKETSELYDALMQAAALQVGSTSRYAFDANISGLKSEVVIATNKDGKATPCLVSSFKTDQAGEHQQLAGQNSWIDRMYQQLQQEGTYGTKSSLSISNTAFDSFAGYNNNVAIEGDCEDVATAILSRAHFLEISANDIKTSLAAVMKQAHPGVRALHNELQHATLCLSYLAHHRLTERQQVDKTHVGMYPCIGLARAAKQDMAQMQANVDTSAPTAAQHMNELSTSPQMCGHAFVAKLYGKNTKVFQNDASHGVLLTEFDDYDLLEGTACSNAYKADEADVQCSVSSTDPLMNSALQTLNKQMPLADAFTVKSELRCKSLQSQQLLPDEFTFAPVSQVNLNKPSFYHSMISIGPMVCACLERSTTGQSPVYPTSPVLRRNVRDIGLQYPLQAEEIEAIRVLVQADAWRYPAHVRCQALPPAEHKLEASVRATMQHGVILKHGNQEVPHDQVGSFENSKKAIAHKLQAQNQWSLTPFSTMYAIQ